MFSLIFFFLIISSGSILAAVFFQKRYEETVPLSVFSIVLLIYIMGLIGNLKLGVYLVCAIAVASYGVSLYQVVRKKSYRQLWRNIVTPGMLFFGITLILFAFCIRGRIPYQWDEFTHWADSVKAMYTINDFVTNPLSLSAVQSYPPAMAIFQYFMMVLNGAFEEWRMNFCYIAFCLSLALPFFKYLTHKNIILNLVIMFALFCGMSIFYSNIFDSLYIDAFLGILFGFCLAYLFVYPELSKINIATLSTGVAVLVLTKDAGLFFAGVTVILLCYVALRNFLTTQRKKASQKILILSSLIPVFLLLFAKISWKIEIALNSAATLFETPVDLIDFWGVLTGRVQNYRSTVLQNFLNFLEGSLNGIYGIERWIPLTHLQLYILFTFLLIGISFLYRRTNANHKTCYTVICGTIIGAWALYIVGLLASYMYKFSEYEALILASCNRYLQIYLTAVLVFLLLTVTAYFTKFVQEKRTVLYVMLVSVLLFTPWTSIKKLVTREYVSVSVSSVYDKYPMIQTLQNEGLGDTRIFILSQQDRGYDFWIYRYYLRPSRVTNHLLWSLGDGPLYDGDIWTAVISAQAWQETLMLQYDYVFIQNCDDSFLAKYSGVFQNPDDIANQQMYRVDHRTGMLEKVLIDG